MEDSDIQPRAIDLGALLDLTFDAVIGRELETGRIRFWNRAAERRYGWSSDEALGCNVHQLLHTEFPEDLEHIQRLLMQVGCWEGELQETTRDGRRLTLVSRWGLQGERRQQVALVLQINSNITDCRRAEEAARALHAEMEQRIEARTRELEEANKELEAFTYSVSHDLRQPLRGLDGYSKALLEDYGDALDDRARHYVGSIRQATSQLDELIDDLLRLSRVNRARIRVEPVSLTDLARQMVAELRASTPDRTVDVVIADDLVTAGDRALLEIVLRNVLDNAWKFTSKSPSTHIEVGSEQRDGETVFFVRDDGAGFDPRYVHRLFVPFQRLHRISEFPGTGIGLVTVQRIVHRHGGRIWAEGEVGKGAIFSFTIGTNHDTPITPREARSR